MSENKKTPLQKAILEAREIENAAMEGAKKVLEDSVYPKIAEAIKETVRELEEGVTINVGDANVNVNVEDGNTSVEIDANEEDLDIQSSDDEMDVDMDSDIDSDEDDIDMDSDEDDLDMDSDEDDMDIDSDEDDDDDDMFEVEGLGDVEEAPVEEAPVEEVPAEEAPVDMSADMDGGGSGFPGLEELSDKLDTIISKLSGAEDVAAEVPAEEIPVGEEAPEEIGAEGEVEVVDDEMAPAGEEFAGAEEEVVAEDDLFEITFEEDEDLFEMEEGLIDEIEIVAEEGDDELDEMKMMGASHSVQRTAGESAGPADAVKNRGRVNENKNKTQKEANTVELEKENKSLRESLKEYKESFKILRKQINEVQTFNAKLAYVNKLFSKGGLTNGEKIQIAENFDKVSTVEEAKVLYNQIISEGNKLTEGKTEQLKSKLKSAATTAIEPATKSETLYESKEMSRMQQLAGIKPLKG